MVVKSLLYTRLSSYCFSSLVTQLVKNLPAMWETWVHREAGSRCSIEAGVAAHRTLLEGEKP